MEIDQSCRPRVAGARPAAAAARSILDGRYLWRVGDADRRVMDSSLRGGKAMDDIKLTITIRFGDGATGAPVIDVTPVTEAVGASERRALPAPRRRWLPTPMEMLGAAG